MTADDTQRLARIRAKKARGDFLDMMDAYVLLRLYDELEAKLAEAKEIANNWRLQYDGAEARIRELESRWTLRELPAEDPNITGPEPEF